MRLIDLKNQAWASFRDIENSFQKLLSPLNAIEYEDIEKLMLIAKKKIRTGDYA